jgi:hypothetical protein
LGWVFSLIIQQAYCTGFGLIGEIEKMKIGDLVMYRGWEESSGRDMPLGIVVKDSRDISDYHRRIRVLWLGEKVPIQASALSIGGNRLTTWVDPKHFEVFNEYR